MFLSYSMEKFGISLNQLKISKFNPEVVRFQESWHAHRKIESDFFITKYNSQEKLHLMKIGINQIF